MEQKKRGGKREGAGRKSTTDPKKAITLYVPKKKIYHFGSEDKLKNTLYDYINKQESPIFASPHNGSSDKDKIVERSPDSKEYPEELMDAVIQINETPKPAYFTKAAWEADKQRRIQELMNNHKPHK